MSEKSSSKSSYFSYDYFPEFGVVPTVSAKALRQAAYKLRGKKSTRVKTSRASGSKVVRVSKTKRYRQSAG